MTETIIKHPPDMTDVKTVKLFDQYAFHYQLIGWGTPVYKSIWVFTVRGVYDPDSEDADSQGWERMEWDTYRGFMVSANTEAEAVALVKAKLADDPILHDNTYWTVELIGTDFRLDTPAQIIMSNFCGG